jgi:hypothetical protein
VRDSGWVEKNLCPPLDNTSKVCYNSAMNEHKDHKIVYIEYACCEYNVVIGEDGEMNFDLLSQEIIDVDTYKYWCNDCDVEVEPRDFGVDLEGTIMLYPLDNQQEV